MKGKRKFTAEFKAKVALEGMQERQTLSELCKKYELHSQPDYAMSNQQGMVLAWDKNGLKNGLHDTDDVSKINEDFY